MTATVTIEKAYFETLLRRYRQYPILHVLSRILIHEIVLNLSVPASYELSIHLSLPSSCSMCLKKI